MIYRHRKSRQVIRPVPGSLEHERLAASEHYEEVKPDRAAPPEAGTGERRDVAATGTATIQTGGKAR